MKRLQIIVGLLMMMAATAIAQDGQVYINGQKHDYTINECGDTLILAALDEVSISTPREFKDREEYLRYRRYKRYAVKVYPYATEAIRIFRELEAATNDMKRRDRKKYIKKLQKELKREFEEPLKKLSKTQGLILTKMIEKELEIPTYDLIKNVRNGFTARYWSTLSRAYGYRLKEGYVRGKDPILDAVLDDLDVSYEVKN